MDYKNMSRIKNYIYPLTFICILLFFSCQQKVEKEYWDNGELKYKVPLKNGKKHGLYKAYYTNGQIFEKIHFRNDTIHGEYLLYYPSGQIKLERYYENGKLEDYKKYYKSGKIYVTANYEDGKRVGLVKGYYKNGKLESKQNFVNDSAHGECLFYYKDGTLKDRFIMDHGRKIYSISYNKEGKVTNESRIPVIKSHDDTVTLGEIYTARIVIPGPTKPEHRLGIIIGEPKQKKYDPGMIFEGFKDYEPPYKLFKYTPDSTGTYYYPVTISYTCENGRYSSNDIFSFYVKDTVR